MMSGQAEMREIPCMYNCRETIAMQAINMKAWHLAKMLAPF